MPRQLLALLTFAALFVQPCMADRKVVAPAMLGQWEGNAKIIMTWCQQQKLPLKLDIAADGSVTGTIGDATLLNGRLKSNRSWLGRLMKIKTDLIIVGDLEGSIIAAEKITRAGVHIPLNFDGMQFTGGLHTSGNAFGGKKRMRLSAGSLTLTHPKTNG